MIGRKNELETLTNNYLDSKSALIDCYGRRRIGKSFLINNYIKDYPHFQFEGLESQSPKTQVRSFTKKILEQFKIKSI
jgi:AAA+ ATPase superfamily predicted ATPase